MPPLTQVWITLQNNFEQYEKWCLGIKLLAIVLAGTGMAGMLPWPGVVALLLVLWLQEGILRTSQSRLGAHLLQLEQRKKLHAHAEEDALLLHTEWLAKRPAASGLVIEYMRNALRPTVAYPYVILVMLPVLNRLLNH